MTEPQPQGEPRATRIRGRRWQLDVFYRSGEWTPPEEARDIQVSVIGGSGGDGPGGALGHFGAVESSWVPLGFIEPPVAITVGPGGAPADELGQAGADGLVLILSRW